MNNAKKIFLLNTAIMTCASLIIRAIGMGFNAYLAGRLGAEGVGLFHITLSVYGMAATLACSGMRLASTRLNSEVAACGESIRRVQSACIRSSGIMGLVAMTLLFSFSEMASRILGDSTMVHPLRVMSFSLPFVAMSSALGGYFTAHGRMGLYAAVQVLEQVIRIGATIFALRVLPPDNTHALLAVTLGMTAAEIASFVCLFVMCLAGIGDAGKGGGGFAKRILRIALPDAFGAWLRSGLSTIEQMLIPRQLEKAAPNGNSLATYGLMQGMAMPVVFFAMAPVMAASAMLIPEVSRMRVLGDREGIQRSVRTALKWVGVYALIVGVCVFILADVISGIVYKNPQTALYIRAISPLIPMFYADSVTDSLLKSLDMQAHCVRINTLECFLRVIVVLILLPCAGVVGYIALLYLGELLNFSLSIRKLLKVSSVHSNVA